jgi:hypothetical protein
MSTVSRTKWLEPVPTRFYCPSGHQWDAAELLGDKIPSPGGSFTYKVLSGPCCRIYWGNGFAEKNQNESSWEPKNRDSRNPEYLRDRKNWTRKYPNYLSYLTDHGYVTVRWELPTQATLPAKACDLVCPLSQPLVA